MENKSIEVGAIIGEEEELTAFDCSMKMFLSAAAPNEISRTEHPAKPWGAQDQIQKTPIVYISRFLEKSPEVVLEIERMDMDIGQVRTQSTVLARIEQEKSFRIMYQFIKLNAFIMFKVTTQYLLALRPNQ